MSLYINDQDLINNCSNTIVYLKDGNVPKTEVSGKVVSVESDGFRLKIQTETTTAIFDVTSVIAVKFAK